MEKKDLFVNCELEHVLNFFWDISRIPRGSGNMEEISRYLQRFGEKLGFESTRDNAQNVVIRKPASPGFEGRPTIMLQAHMDMVCEKTSESTHDFLREPIEIQREGDKIYAKQTTLGADNGIGVAFIMEILSNESICHPMLEAVFTANEETDMSGAQGLDYGCFQSRTIVNVDATGITCGGSGELEMEISIPHILRKVPEGYVGWVLSVSGLIGGHTGDNAMQGRGNANHILTRILCGIQECCPILIADMCGGGSMSTALARTAECRFYVSERNTEIVAEIVREWSLVMENELKVSDPMVEITLKPDKDLCERVCDRKTTETFLSLLQTLPEGLLAVNQDVSGVMETVVNTGIVKMRENDFYILFLVRSFFGSKRKMVRDKVKQICWLHGATCAVTRDLPEWPYRADSPAVGLARQIMPERKCIVSQGTLESGIFLANMQGADMIGLGPKVYNPHSPNEYILISETEDYWKELIAFLGRYK